jgi:predicted dehydrogenase
MLASNPATTLAGVWSRRPEASEEMASRHQTTAFHSIEEMLVYVDALSFAVPPNVQAEVAMVAALRGKALLLEKPIALDLGHARDLASVIGETGVSTQLVLTWRYVERVRSLLEAVHQCEPLGGRGHFLTGGFLGGMFATPWRLDRGPLWDLGPHVVDLLDAALGPIDEVTARGDLHRWVDLHLVHASGTVSQASITAYSRLDPARAGVAIYHSDGVHEVDVTDVSTEAAPNIASEFAEIVRNHQSHALDVQRGLYIQEILTSAALDLDRSH